MTVREIVKIACEDNEMNLSQLANLVGMSQGNLSHAIKRLDGGMNMKVATLLDLLNHTDSTIIIETSAGIKYILDGIEEDEEDYDMY